jgi:hypothetical protein
MMGSNLGGPVIFELHKKRLTGISKLLALPKSGWEVPKQLPQEQSVKAREDYRKIGSGNDPGRVEEQSPEEQGEAPAPPPESRLRGLQTCCPQWLIRVDMA